MAESRLVAWDMVVVVVYFVAVVSIGLYASCRAKRGSLSGYFLAGRNMSFITVGASLFVSNIGSEHFIGLAGSGAAGGIGVGAWEFNAILLLQLLGWVFLPVYIACQTYTMPEYLSRRFGGERLRIYFTFLSLILYIFTKISVDLYTGALFIQQSIGWDLYLSIFILIAITAVLTITGGLTAVIYTDTLQAALMVGGAIVLMIYAFIDVEGYDGLVRKYPAAVPNVTVPNTTCHLASENAFTMLRDPADPDLPWPGFLLGQTPGSIWYWCTDQVIVQRALAAKSLSHAQGATLMAGVIKILPLFIMVMPGMISRIKYANDVACVDPDECYRICQSRAGCTNIAYPRLVLGLMPDGLRGLMMAVMVAAIMSDLDSIFNSASTLFTIDVWKRIRKNASVREMLVVGRLFILVMVGVAIAWVPVIQQTQGGQVFIYIQEVSNYLAPPVSAVFLMALLWSRFNEQGCFWALMAGFVTGVTRLILVFVFPAPESCGQPDNRPDVIRNLHYMYFAILLFWVTVISGIIVTYLTPPPTPQQLLRTTYWSRHDKRSLEAVTAGYHSNAADATTQTASGDFDNPAFEPDSKDEELKAEAASGDHTTRSVFTITEAQAGEVEAQRPSKLTDRLLEFVCGFNPADGDGGKMADRDTREQERHLYIESLHQDPKTKLALTLGLLAILGTGIFLYVFWSTWKYVPLPLDEGVSSSPI